MKPLELVLIEEILNTHFDIPAEKIVGLYPYGSVMYGTITEKSDYDFVVIVGINGDVYKQYETTNVDIHIMSIETYNNKLKEHDIMCLECFYNPTPIIEFKTEFKLDKPTLRKRISAICNNSWAKAGKKLNLPEEDDYIGLKSLFHSFRILSYGIDMARENKINFKTVGKFSTQYFMSEILVNYDMGYGWEQFKEKYKKEHNAMATEFRELAPKE
jgi:hypothetical protein